MSSSATATAILPTIESKQPTYCDPSATPYIVTDLFPVRRVHLVVGPSGAGKTRWLFPMINDYLSGKQIFEHNSHPLPCGYLACDRPAEAAKETLASLKLDMLTPDIMPIRSMMDIDADFHYDILPKLFDKSVRVIFVEALAALIPNGKINDYHSVLRFFKALYRLMGKHDLTIIGSVHQPKMREDESFSHPRDKVLGSVAWAACSDTVILIEPSNPRDTGSTRRRMTVLPRNEQGLEYQLDFNDLGHLVTVGGDTDTYRFLLDQELNSIARNEPIETSTFQEWGQKHKIHRRSVESWITLKMEQSELERIRRGVYRRPTQN